MNRVKIKLENCFGIGKLDYEFDFNGCNSFLIYAPNGTMKTSFAKTLGLISKADAKLRPEDRVYEERVSNYSVEVDGNKISGEAILVVDSEDSDYDSSDKISSFIASKELKKKYDKIYSELDKHKKEYIKKLKQVSQSSDCENELVETYSNSSKNTFFEILLEISGGMLTNPTTYNFRYNDIFDKKGSVKKFLEKNQELLKEYFGKYEELLSNSKFFRSSNNSFGTHQANELLKSIDDNSYFDAGHVFKLSNNEEIRSVIELKQLLENEIEAIVNDENLRKTFDKVDKAIGANAELRAFKKAIENDNLLLLELKNYEDFRKKFWLNWVSILENDTKEIVKFYNDKKEDLEEIVKLSKNEIALWKGIINTFNERFFVPFEIELANQEDVILKEQTANLAFIYKDRNDSPVQKEKDALLSILSRGEKRAFYILQLLFDIESRKHQRKKTLLIFDDIADSFDYKNKYAIIEYLRELHQNPLFRLIILTHNFDFFRTVATRIGINRHKLLMTLRNNNREISFEQGQYIRDIFSHFKQNITQEKFFISAIPLIRNLIEYMEGDSSDDYLKLTSCLHIKPDTADISCRDILLLIHKIFPSTSGQKIKFGDKLIKELIYETADFIETCEIKNEILLENKITLSIAIRLKAEEFMISKIPSESYLKIKSNQTTELLNQFKKTDPDKSTIILLDRVILMTPENIHLNAFMFEPLVDISVFHLIELYRNIKRLS